MVHEYGFLLESLSFLSVARLLIINLSTPRTESISGEY